MKISKTIEDFIQALNDHNAEMLLRLIKDDAVINDEGQDYSGIAEIKKWYDVKVVGSMVTLEPTNAVERDGKTNVTAIVDGTFDKTGLPDPLKLDFHFTIDGNRVSALTIQFPKE